MVLTTLSVPRAHYPHNWLTEEYHSPHLVQSITMDLEVPFTGPHGSGGFSQHNVYRDRAQIPLLTYLRHKMSYQRDVCISFLPAPSYVRDDRQHTASAHHVHHTVQDGLLEVQPDQHV